MNRLTAPLITSGTLMAAYLLLRPYGDTSGDQAHTAAAFASWQWVASHVSGLLALAAWAWLTQRLVDTSRSHGTPTHISLSARVARGTGLAGALLALPYYGAETFGLHALGRAHQADATFALTELTDAVRNQPVALTLFAVGLLALAASGIATALTWRQLATTRRWAAWPVGVLLALFLPQFYLPPTGRMAYGVAFAVAAVSLAVAARTQRRPMGVQHTTEAGIPVAH